MSAVDAAEQVFDEWRTSRMNRLYCESRLAQESRKTRNLDVVTVVATSLVGLGIWFVPVNDVVGGIAKLLAIVAALASVYQLIARPGECAAAFEAHVAVYEQLDATLGAIVRRIRAMDYDESVLEEMEKAKRALSSVKLRRVEPEPDKFLLSAAFERAQREIPTDFFAR